MQVLNPSAVNITISFFELCVIFVVKGICLCVCVCILRVACKCRRIMFGNSGECEMVRYAHGLFVGDTIWQHLWEVVVSLTAMVLVGIICMSYYI